MESSGIVRNSGVLKFFFTIYLRGFPGGLDVKYEKRQLKAHSKTLSLVTGRKEKHVEEASLGGKSEI